MPLRETTFELTVPEITFDLEWDYYYDPGKYFGKPEDCYPAEEECSVELPDGWEEAIRQQYAKAAEDAIKTVGLKVCWMAASRMPREWAADAKGNT